MPDTRFGFATHFAQGWSTSLMPLIAATGCAYIRDDLSTGGWEPTPGTYAVPASDKTWIDSAHANGLLVVGIISKNNSYVSGDPYDATFMANRAKFIAQSGLVDVIEVVNEPNNDFQTVEGSANWESKLATLTTAVTNAVNSVSSTVQVIGLGAQGNQIISILGSTTVDGIVYHPYDNDNGTVATFIPETVFEGSFTNYEGWLGNIMAATPLPLWETEWGTQTVTGFSEDNQATFLVRRLLISMACAVDHTFIYEFKDNNATDLYGVYNQAGTTAKASYAVVTRFISAMQGVVGTRAAAVPASSGFANRSFGVTINSVANGNTAQTYAYLFTGARKTVVATWLGNTSPTNPPAATTTSITFTVSNPYSVAGSSVLNPIAGTSVPLSNFTTSVSGTSLTVSGLPLSDHPLLIILMAANHFVVPGGATTGTASTWATAWEMNSINWADVNAGDTIWIAGGSYPNGMSTVTKGGASGSPITVQRVVSSDPVGTGFAGFQSSFDSPIVMGLGNNGIFIPNTGTNWLVFSGRTNGGWIINCPLGTNGGQFDCVSVGSGGGGGGQTLSNISFFFINIIGPQPPIQNSGGISGAALHGFAFSYNNTSLSNILVNNCESRGLTELVRSNGWTNVIIEHSYFADSIFTTTDHDDICYANEGDVNTIWRYNTIANSFADGFFFDSGNAAQGWHFYGNMCYNFQGAWYIVTKLDATQGNNAGPVYIYNNTFFGQGNGQISFNGAPINGASFIYNNIFYGVTNNMGPGNGTGGTSTSDYNAYGGGSTKPAGETHSISLSVIPWTSSPPVQTAPAARAVPWGSSGDFHPTTAGGSILGVGLATLPNPNSDPQESVDSDGNARGGANGWTIGAYQFVSGSPAPAPSVPTALAVGTITSSTIALSWTTSTDAPNTNASLTYNLERKTGAGAFTTIKTGIAGVSSGSISYTDSNLTASTLYTYNVQAQNPGGLTSAFTTTNAAGTTTAAAPAPSVPTGLATGSVTSSSIALSWTTSTDSPDTNASLTYKLERKLAAGSFTTLPAVIPGVASGLVSFTDTGLAASSLYTYNVQAVNQEGLSSAFSTTNASATTSAAPAVAFIQIAESGAPSGTATSKTATYASAQTAGHTNIVVINIGNASSATLGVTISSVTDTKGNTYVSAPPGLVAMSVSTLSQGSQVFYASNILAATAGSNTVTVTASIAASFFDIAVLEYAGLAATSPVDVSISAAVNGSGATSNATSGSVTTLNANDLLVGAFSFFDAPTTPGTGYTARNSPAPYTLYVEDQLVTSTGSVAATATASAGGSGWTAQLIAFKAAAGGGTTTLTDVVALLPGTVLSLASSAGHRGKASFLSGSILSGKSRDTHRAVALNFPGSLLKGTAVLGGSFALPDATSIIPGTVLSFNARRTYRAVAGFNPGTGSLFNPTLNGIIAPQMIQSNSATPASASSINCTYAQAQKAGDANVIIVGWTNASALTITSVTDTVNGPYIVGVPLATNGTVQQAMYYLPNILAASAGTNIVTVVLSGVAAAPDVRILEYSGIVTVFPIDATGSAAGNNASPSVSISSFNTSDLVVSGGTTTANFLASGALFTNRLLTADGNLADDAVFIWGQWVNGVGTSGNWINTGSVQGPWFG